METNPGKRRSDKGGCSVCHALSRLAILVAVGVIIAACTGDNSGSTETASSTTDEASTTEAQQQAPTETAGGIVDEASTTEAQQETTTSVVDVAELAGAVWESFCSNENSLSLVPGMIDPGDEDPWVDAAKGLEAALAPDGQDISTQGAELRSAFQDAVEARTTLGVAIEEAIAEQTIVDCDTGPCTLVFSGEEVYVLGSDTPLVGLDVGGSVASFNVSLGAIQSVALDVGLPLCPVIAYSEG